jgi:hypothetical protein
MNLIRFGITDSRWRALTENPPAQDLSGLLAVYHLCKRGARIQVVEQYIYNRFIVHN